MNDSINLHDLLSQSSSRRQQLAYFALLSLGIIESLTNGLIGVSGSQQMFFHAENCLFVHKHMRDRIADQIMSRGVQLPDLFEALPLDQAQREFQRELTAMHALCLSLLEEKRIAA